ncbi:insulin-induced protein-domain-containing protein [Boeremia exigua]|uniref:insulin-induced protein-domain-containing protein n=1 Tax=Boeremia exigua TaxID=749465 RepID=UPI001E8E3687|nr:insulin-induced protein-domain-containing protein [Boeremia exigua]KAH6629778.1 insulin-induced protein-domain-containing protein [Boeremia exigua]
MADDVRASRDREDSQPHIYRPVPRRAFNPASLAADDTHPLPHTQQNTYQEDSEDASSPSHAYAPLTSRRSDFLAQLNARLLRTYHTRRGDETPESPSDSASGYASNPGGALGGALGGVPSGPGGTLSGFASSATLPHTKSGLNMGSTLYGIYDDVGSVAETPWGAGAETPGHGAMGWHGADGEGEGDADAEGEGLSMKKVRRGGDTHGAQRSGDVHRGSAQRSAQRRASTGARGRALLALKVLALAIFGALYGTIVSHLHDTRHLASVHVAGVERGGWVYVAAWGAAGVVLGGLMPVVDALWGRSGGENDGREGSEKEGGAREAEAEGVPLSDQVNDVVRSVAAFVGIGFAIRRLPWQSTLQLTLTLALVNPALWYILDRSKPGLSFSLAVSSVITTCVFFVNPPSPASPLPSPSFPTPSTSTPFTPAGAGRPANATALHSQDLFAGVITYENLAVVTWVGSVLFCSCVCFGNIGRRLAVWEGGWRRS